MPSPHRCQRAGARRTHVPAIRSLPVAVFQARDLVEDRLVGAVVDAAKDPLGRIDINGRDMDGYSATNKQKEVILHEDKVFE